MLEMNLNTSSGRGIGTSMRREVNADEYADPHKDIGKDTDTSTDMYTYRHGGKHMYIYTNAVKFQIQIYMPIEMDMAKQRPTQPWKEKAIKHVDIQP